MTIRIAFFILFSIVLISCDKSDTPITNIPVEEFSGETPRPVTRDNIAILLTSGNYDERLIAISAIPNLAISTEEVVPLLMENLTYENGYRVRQASANALGELGIEAELAVPDLIQALNDNSPHVRGASATALGKIDHYSAIPFLTNVLYDDNKIANIQAVNAIELILNIDFSNSPNEMLNSQGIPIGVIEAREWWENDGQFEDWPTIPNNN